MPKARRPKADDEFNIDELANSPALYGIEDAYRRFTTGPQLVEKRPAPAEMTPAVSSGAVSSGAPDLTVSVAAADPNYPIIERSPADQRGGSAPKLAAPELTAPPLGAPALDAPINAPSHAAPQYNFDEYAIYPRREYRPVPANTVQDGHTHGQQSVYSTLWRLGKAYGHNAKAVAIGERTLATEVPMSYSSLQDNVRALVEKHSIEIQPRGPNKPKLYIAYSYEEILRRRRALGLTHVIRRTTGVILCTSSGAPILTASDQNAGAVNSGAVERSVGAPSLPGSGAPSSGAALIRKEEIVSGIPTPSTLSSVTSAIRQYMEIDDDAVRRIIEACRQLAPDATDEELVHFSTVCAARIVSARGISSPVGLLIKQTPKFFEGVSLKQFRKQEEQRREEKRRQIEAAEQETRALAESILNDTGASAEEREWALSVLGRNE